MRALEPQIAGSTAFPCDVADLDALAETLRAVRRDLGSPSVVIHNAVSETFATFLDADPAALERNFRVNTTALLHLARACAPDMIGGPRRARRHRQHDRRAAARSSSPATRLRCAANRTTRCSRRPRPRSAASPKRSPAISARSAFMWDT
ncbi:SDR family NAD(P)-dependent oxidoreductase [Burkholderia alba]|uniref:SDR family NAD(P)-dependent oxidoreductase n=1 Tax=Burkholderia alba TaxID=2683677 RepID=UPI002B062707|nr:SDR family NAD(P)-dependent oxidoreductase [Burkholderia alba]